MTFQNYHDVLSRFRKMDAVIVSVPDHHHALVAGSAAIARKHIYVQKPLTYSIAESIALCSAVCAQRRLFCKPARSNVPEHPFTAFSPGLGSRAQWPDRQADEN